MAGLVQNDVIKIKKELLKTTNAIDGTKITEEICDIVEEILKRLVALSVSVDILTTTQIGKTVNRVRSLFKKSNRVSTLCKNITDGWKERVIEKRESIKENLKKRKEEISSGTKIVVKLEDQDELSYPLKRKKKNQDSQETTENSTQVEFLVPAVKTPISLHRSYTSKTLPYYRKLLGSNEEKIEPSNVAIKEEPLDDNDYQEAHGQNSKTKTNKKSEKEVECSLSIETCNSGHKTSGKEKSEYVVSTSFTGSQPFATPGTEEEVSNYDIQRCDKSGRPGGQPVIRNENRIEKDQTLNKKQNNYQKEISNRNTSSLLLSDVQENHSSTTTSILPIENTQFILNQSKGSFFHSSVLTNCDSMKEVVLTGNPEQARLQECYPHQTAETFIGRDMPEKYFDDQHHSADSPTDQNEDMAAKTKSVMEALTEVGSIMTKTLCSIDIVENYCKKLREDVNEAQTKMIQIQTLVFGDEKPWFPRKVVQKQTVPKTVQTIKKRSPSLKPEKKRLKTAQGSDELVKDTDENTREESSVGNANKESEHLNRCLGSTFGRVSDNVVSTPVSTVSANCGNDPTEETEMISSGTIRSSLIHEPTKGPVTYRLPKISRSPEENVQSKQKEQEEETDELLCFTQVVDDMEISSELAPVKAQSLRKNKQKLRKSWNDTCKKESGIHYSPLGKNGHTGALKAMHERTVAKEAIKYVLTKQKKKKSNLL